MISNKSINGFKLNTNAVTEDFSTIITAKLNIDGIEKTITKTINVVYQQIFNEFKVYKDSAWIVPNSNVEVKVGDVVAQYIGEGLWMVDDTLVNETMDVTAGGVVLDKYGKNEYSDGSEINLTLISEESTRYSSAYSRTRFTTANIPFMLPSNDLVSQFKFAEKDVLYIVEMDIVHMLQK